MEGAINSPMFSVSCSFSVFIFFKSDVSPCKICSLIMKKDYFLTELLAVKGLHYSFCTSTFLFGKLCENTSVLSYFEPTEI